MYYIQQKLEMMKLKYLTIKSIGKPFLQKNRDEENYKKLYFQLIEWSIEW